MSMHDLEKQMLQQEAQKRLAMCGSKDLQSLPFPRRGMTQAELSNLISHASALAAAEACKGTENIVGGLIGYVMHPGFNANHKDIQNVLEAFASQIAAAVAMNISQTFDVPLVNVLGRINGNISTISLQHMENENANAKQQTGLQS